MIRLPSALALALLAAVPAAAQSLTGQGSAPAAVTDATLPGAVANRGTLTQTQVAVPAGVSTLLLPANAARRFLRISGTNAGDAFRLGYGVAATATSSALFGSGGVFTAEQFGSADTGPTGAIYGFSASAFTAQVGEGN